MSTDLDTTLTAALRDAASTTSVSDDALSSIVRRADRSTSRRPTRRALVAGVTVLAATAVAGATYAVVDRLSADQVDIIEPMTPTCGLETERAQLVASYTGFGRTVDYWTVDGADTFGDFTFGRGSTDGSGGCGAMSRETAHPDLPWVNGDISSNGEGSTVFTFYGQAPPGTDAVEIATSAGSVRTPIETGDGYFIVLAELPDDGSNNIERIDAYAADGDLIATGGVS